ncbi:L,D-transpeptidase [Bosea sp. 117]|uniref:L,D-transpeptidase family protein n=1 Tax=Bosea sp. 117 TaxID=1125973 RepID=UPI000570A2F0|nr:L,D-transpeptidase [Bosea sp. 117]
MALRLGFASAVALSMVASIGVASAQYYPPEQSAEPTYAPPADNVEVPAAYDPYGTSASTGPVAAPPANAPYAQPGGVYAPPVAAAPAPGYGAPNQAPPAATQPPSYSRSGYPAGAYSGQQPAGMSSPYGNAPTYQQAPQQQAAYPAQPPANGGYAPPAPVSSAAPYGGGYDSSASGANGSTVAMLPPEDQPEEGPPKELPANLKRQVVDYVSKEPAGTIIIDTPNTYLYYVLGGGKAERYGIGVGREGFTWAGTEKISGKKEWADWRPPAEMIERQPYLPRFMAGGPGNPLGARTMYLGGTIYRIHGTNQPSTIGQFMSSGCIRMLNEDVEALYDKVKIGTRVVVLPGNPPAKTAASTPEPLPGTDPGGVATR